MADNKSCSPSTPTQAVSSRQWREILDIPLLVMIQTSKNKSAVSEFVKIPKQELLAARGLVAGYGKKPVLMGDRKSVV